MKWIHEISTVGLIFLTTAFFVTQSYERVHIKEISETPEVSFEVHIKPIMIRACAECHSGFSDWTVYKNSADHRYQIYEKIVVEKSMPIGKEMNDEDRALFRDWVNQGSKR